MTDGHHMGANYKVIGLAFAGIAAVSIATILLVGGGKKNPGKVGSAGGIFAIYKKEPDGFVLVSVYGTAEEAIAQGEELYSVEHAPTMAIAWTGEDAAPSVLNLESDGPWTEIGSWGGPSED